MPRENRLPQGESHRIKADLIIRSGNRCQGCGYQFPKGLHPHQLARNQGAFELDHNVPVKRGGSDHPSNRQVLCLPCHDGKTNNARKGGNPRNMTDTEWRNAGMPQDWTRKRMLIQERQSQYLVE